MTPASLILIAFSHMLDGFTLGIITRNGYPIQKCDCLTWHLPNLYPASMTFETVWAGSCWGSYLAVIRHRWLKTYKSCLAMSNPCREENCWDGPKEAAANGFMGRFGSRGIRREERVCLPGRTPSLKGEISRKSSCCNRSPTGCSRLPGRAPICY